MKKFIVEYLSKNFDHNFKVFGIEDYIQIMIEPGATIASWIISDWCSELDCCSYISCVHSDAMGGYCLMIELSR